MTSLLTLTCIAILTGMFCNYVESNNKADKTKKENKITYLN